MNASPRACACARPLLTLSSNQRHSHPCVWSDLVLITCTNSVRSDPHWHQIDGGMATWWMRSWGVGGTRETERGPGPVVGVFELRRSVLYESLTQRSGFSPCSGGCGPSLTYLAVRACPRLAWKCEPVKSRLSLNVSPLARPLFIGEKEIV